jgi:DNA-directed RNA polymerase subunit RPC12/RpoP
MKKVFVKGHPLTEDVMKEVKGGYKLISDEEPEKCPQCDCLTIISTNLGNGLKKYVCANCGAVVNNSPDLELI